MVTIALPKWMVKDTEPDQEVCLVALRATKFAREFMFNDMQLVRSITIDLDVPPPLVPDTEDDLCRERIGTCEPMNNEYKKTSLHIVCSPLQKPLVFIDCLFHELQHAKQAFENRLLHSTIPGKKPLSLWQGKAFSTRLIEYEDWPWEIEARKVADEMLHKFLQKYPNTIL